MTKGLRTSACTLAPERPDRRDFIRKAGILGLLAGYGLGQAKSFAAAQLLPSAPRGAQTAPGVWDLSLDERTINLLGRPQRAQLINGSMPGPLLHFKEGQDVTIRVTNHLPTDTGIHWHGIIVPPQMDGVPGLSFPGIKPNETFTYRFPIKQSGTYWYHAHFALQEASGVFGPLIIDPIQPEPYHYDRDYVVFLSDWLTEAPLQVVANLKKVPGYYNWHQRTVGDLVRDYEAARTPAEKKAVLDNQLMWDKMRMDPTDLSDVGENAWLLMNGQRADQNWTALFRPGERVRLRFINGSAMTFYDVKIPGLKMTIVQADGQDVAPVPVDEFRIFNAETYDVIVEPKEDRAYTIFAEAFARTGYARGTLAPRRGMSAPIPPMDPRTVRTMADMGMGGMAGMNMGGGQSMPGMNMGDSQGAGGTQGHEMSGMGTVGQQSMSSMPGMSGHSAGHATGSMSGHNMAGMQNMQGMETPGHVVSGGLQGGGVAQAQHAGYRKLTYNDLRALVPTADQRPPDREFHVRLTGDMNRYFWTINDRKMSETEPIRVKSGERVRLRMVNETMMEHPMHLHGTFMSLVNGQGQYEPRKHTVIVNPAQTVLVDFTGPEPGNWAFHCHLLFHMATGMMTFVQTTA